MSLIDDDAHDTPSLPDQLIKRAPVVYGKRLNHCPPPSDAAPVDDQVQPSVLNRVNHVCTTTPRRRLSSPSPSVHAPGSERSRSPEAAFQFDFKHRLEELDAQFDDHDVQSSTLGPSSSRHAEHVKLSEGKDLQSVSMGTAILYGEGRHSSRDLSPASSSSPASLRATATQENSPETSLVRRRTKRVPNLVPSDSEAEGPNKSSSVSPIRHAITTPHSRSSPTPPTSGEIPMMSGKAKGKATARDVLPLLFDCGPSTTKLLKKERQSEPLVRHKTKAPTKKERREAAFESSRIAANRPVEVARSQEQRHSLSAFFAGLRRDNIVITTPGTELSSDPIERFSSPTDLSTRMPLENSLFGTPTQLLRPSAHVGTTSNQQFLSGYSKALPPAAGDSDDEMPPVISVIQQATEKQQRLRKIKEVVLQQADEGSTVAVDSEDDLLIVKDDMHIVAREEAAQRRLNKAPGSPTKITTSLRRINHPSIRPVAASPQKLSRQELQELAKPSFARIGKGSRGQLGKKQLDQLMIEQHTREQIESIRRHEEEWVRKGGKLSRDTGDDITQTSLSQTFEAYAEKRFKAVAEGHAIRDEASTDESDEDYTLDVRGSASPEPMDTNEDDAEPGDNMEVTEVPPPLADDGDEEDEFVAPLRRTKPAQRHHRVVGSDDEEEQTVLPAVQKDSISSMESQTEDENDKENSAKLMYDRSEDKENKAVVRHELSPSEPAFGSRPGSQHAIEIGTQRSLLSLASVSDSPRGHVRSPLKDISKDEDDSFLSPPPSRSPPHASASTLSLGSPPVLRSERINRINRLCLDSENDENDASRFKPLQPSFLERLHSEISPGPSLSSINPLPNGGFSQLFSAEDQCSKGPIEGVERDRLSLTLDVGLKPALEVSATLRQRAETIFEKEQEYLVAATVQQIDKPKELLYVNDHGFLTQTRPEGSSPQVYRMTPSQASKAIGTQVHSTQTYPLSMRPPLRTLSFTISQGSSPEPQPLRRLRKRSPSPLEQKTLGQNSNPVSELNAFSILGKVPDPPCKIQREKSQKSEFVTVEAEESDEDDMFGFGGPKKNDDQEEEDDQDRVVEGLVDDTVMDMEAEAAHLVQEKYKEHEEDDDQRLQKLHQDVVDGKFRMKRRDRGVGFEDDSDDDDDDDARRIRQRMSKKRKIEGDTLEALGQTEETRAFYNTYHQDLIDEDNDFGHLQEDAAMPADDGDAQVEEPEERETVSVDEIRQRVRDTAQDNYEVEALDPEDTSWIDRSMVVEADDAVRVRLVKHHRSKSTARHPNVGQMDFDEERRQRHTESQQEREQMTSWAKNQTGSRYQGTGRSGNSAAVTGHTKAKSGGGSLRSAQNPPSVKGTRKTKTSSLLSTMSNRKDKFAA